MAQMIASFKFLAESADIRNAYLTGDDLARSIYIRVPSSGLGDLVGNEIVRAKKGLYGLVDAARQFFLFLRSKLSALNFKQSIQDPALFYLVCPETNQTCALCLCHVDDLFMG